MLSFWYIVYNVIWHSNIQHVCDTQSSLASGNTGLMITGSSVFVECSRLSSLELLSFYAYPCLCHALPQVPYFALLLLLLTMVSEEMSSYQWDFVWLPFQHTFPNPLFSSSFICFVFFNRTFTTTTFGFMNYLLPTATLVCNLHKSNVFWMKCLHNSQ